MKQTYLNIGRRGTQTWPWNEATQDRLKAIAFSATEWDSKRLVEFNILGQIISPRVGFNLRQVNVRFMVDKWDWFMFPSEHIRYPISISIQQSIIFTQLRSPTFRCFFKSARFDSCNLSKTLLQLCFVVVNQAVM